MPGASSRPSESFSEADRQLVGLLEEQSHVYDFTDWLPQESGHANMLDADAGEHWPCGLLCGKASAAALACSKRSQTYKAFIHSP